MQKVLHSSAYPGKGSVAEWLKALVSKTSIRETVSRVQISPLPQEFIIRS